LKIIGTFITLDELMNFALEDRVFYETSGGGVTLGGGEAAMQGEASVSLLRGCKSKGIHTAVETSGNVDAEVLQELSEFSDLFLYDLKGYDEGEHLLNTGGSNSRILDNLRMLLVMGANVRVRMPLIHGMNDRRDNIGNICEFLGPFRHEVNFDGIDLLPYHKLGRHKYTQLGRAYMLDADTTMTEEGLCDIERLILGYGIKAKIIRH
jgi:pyruvate formate lyase activating enzyme